MPLHIDPAATKGNALRFQTKPLLDCGIAPQFDLAARTEDALPGKPERTMKRASYLAGAAGESCCAGNGSVGRNFATRNLPYRHLNCLPGV